MTSSILANGYSSQLLAGCLNPCRGTSRTVGGKTAFLGGRSERVASSGRRGADLEPVLTVAVCTAPTTPPQLPAAVADGLALTPSAAATGTLRSGCGAAGDRWFAGDERGAASDAGGGMGAAAVVGVGGGCEEAVPSLGVRGVCIGGTPGESAADSPGAIDVDGVS